MTSIKYSPTTQGQTFGNPGDLFAGAARSLDKATSGLSNAFDTYRQGAIEEKDRRTQDAITAIQSAQSPDAYRNLRSELSDPAAFAQAFGDVDTNKVLGALRKQEGAVTQKQIQDFQTQRTLSEQADAPALQNLAAQLPSLSDSEFRSMAQDGSFLNQFENPLLGRELLQKEAVRRSGIARNQLETQKTQLSIDKLESELNKARVSKANQTTLNDLYTKLQDASGNVDRNVFTAAAADLNISPTASNNFIKAINDATGVTEQRELDKAAIDTRKDILARFDTEDDRLGIATSSRVEAENAIAEMKELKLSETQINNILRQVLEGEDDFGSTKYDDIISAIKLQREGKSIVEDFERNLKGRNLVR